MHINHRTYHKTSSLHNMPSEDDTQDDDTQDNDKKTKVNTTPLYILFYLFWLTAIVTWYYKPAPINHINKRRQDAQDKLNIPFLLHWFLCNIIIATYFLAQPLIVSLYAFKKISSSTLQLLFPITLMALIGIIVWLLFDPFTDKHSSNPYTQSELTLVSIGGIFVMALFIFLASFVLICTSRVDLQQIQTAVSQSKYVRYHPLTTFTLDKYPYMYTFQ